MRPCPPKVKATRSNRIGAPNSADCPSIAADNRRNYAGAKSGEKPRAKKIITAAFGGEKVRITAVDWLILSNADSAYVVLSGRCAPRLRACPLWLMLSLRRSARQIASSLGQSARHASFWREIKRGHVLHMVTHVRQDRGEPSLDMPWDAVLVGRNFKGRC